MCTTHHMIVGVFSLYLHGQTIFFVALTNYYFERTTKLKICNAILRQIKCYCLHENKEKIENNLNINIMLQIRRTTIKSTLPSLHNIVE